VARMGEERKVYKLLWESPTERDHLADRGVDGRWDQNGSYRDSLGVWSDSG
jgi:hypothetical protein